MERPELQRPWEAFNGDWSRFVEAVNSENLGIVYDLDGMLFYTTYDVFQNFSIETGIDIYPKDVDRWDYLEYVATESGLDQDTVKKARAKWFDPKIIGRNAKRYSYTKPLVRLTTTLAGPENNYLLTSRPTNIPEMKEETELLIKKHFPIIPIQNLSMYNPDAGIQAPETKAIELVKLAPRYDWLIFMDDSVDNIRKALDTGLDNLVAINVPQGVIIPDFDDDRLITLGRYPNEIQSMYPLYNAFKCAVGERKNN